MHTFNSFLAAVHSFKSTKSTQCLAAKQNREKPNQIFKLHKLKDEKTINSRHSNCTHINGFATLDILQLDTCRQISPHLLLLLCALRRTPQMNKSSRSLIDVDKFVRIHIKFRRCGSTSLFFNGRLHRMRECETKKHRLHYSLHTRHIQIYSRISTTQ